MLQAAAERPPYVTFETRAVEDRAVSIETGHYVAKDVTFALITPAGSKDRIELEALTWLQQLERDVQNGRCNPLWLTHFKELYRAWTDGQEAPLNGTAISSWPALSPAQARTVLAANIRTVEDLAVANEAALAAIGMGGRTLKLKAEAWVASAAGPGKVGEELASLRVANETLITRNDALAKQVETLSTQLQGFMAAQTSNTEHKKGKG